MRHFAMLSLVACICACPGDAVEAPAGEQLVGLTWQVVTPRYEPGALFSAWGTGPNDVWLAGGERGRPLVFRYDGQYWTTEDSGTA